MIAAFSAFTTAYYWSHFKPVLSKAFRKERKSNAGRPPFDYVIMFKVLVLQTMYNLSDAQTQFQILDRYTFRRFLGIQAESQIPDEKTVWVFRETLNPYAAVAGGSRAFLVSGCIIRLHAPQPGPPADLRHEGQPGSVSGG